jgi:hypothetical protein
MTMTSIIHRHHRPNSSFWTRRPAPSYSRLVLFGLLGGFGGALAMGSVVPLPDALCLALATKIIGTSSGTAYAMGWIFHLVTGLSFGAIFGAGLSIVAKHRVNSLVRCLSLGITAGILVWAGFFMPAVAVLLPSMISGSLVAQSFASHLVFGLVLGGVVGTISCRGIRAVEPSENVHSSSAASTNSQRYSTLDFGATH